MANRPSAPFLIVGIVIAVGAMAMLNNAQYQNRPKTPQELEAEEAAQSAKQPKPTPSAPQGPTSADKLVEMEPDAVVGDKGAKKTLTIGYHWTPAVQEDPMRIYGPVEMISRMASGMVKVRVVNLDVPGAPAVPEGLSGGGKVFARLTPEGGFDPSVMQRAFGEAMKAGAIPEDAGGKSGK